MYINCISPSRNNVSDFTFTSKKYPEATAVFNKLDNKFVQDLKDKGFTNSFLIVVINRMCMSPGFKKKTFAQVVEDISKKVIEILPMLKTKEGLKKLTAHYGLSEVVLKPLENRQEFFRKKEAVLKLYREGFSVNKIIQMVGLSYEPVHRILNGKRGVFGNGLSVKNRNVIKLVKEGCTDAEISLITGLSKSRICTIRREHDLAVNRKNIELRDLEIVGRMLQGATREEVAKEFGLQIRSLESIFRKHDVCNRVKQIRDNKIIEMVKLGVPKNVIKSELKISRETINRVLQKADLID